MDKSIQVASAEGAGKLIYTFYNQAFEALVDSGIEEDSAKAVFIENYVDHLCEMYEKGITDPQIIYPGYTIYIDDEPDENKDKIVAIGMDHYDDSDLIAELRTPR